MRKLSVIKFSILIVFTIFSMPNIMAAKIFKQPITIVCAFSPGGATDMVNRALAEGMKQYLKVPINVINMTGNNGGNAAEFVLKNSHNGNYLLGTSETSLFLPVNGGHYSTTKDWEYFMVGGSKGVVLVPADSPYKTFKDLIIDAKAKPGNIRATAAVQGGLWHTKWMLITKAAGINVKMLNMDGSKPSLIAGLSGDADVVHVSLGEALPYIQKNQLRALCVSETTPHKSSELGLIPSITNDLPALKKVFPLSMWSGMAVPANTPKPVVDELNQAFKAAMKSQIVLNALAQQVAVPYGYYGSKAKKFAQNLEAKFCWTLYDLGTAKHNPTDFKISRPKNL